MYFSSFSIVLSGKGGQDGHFVGCIKDCGKAEIGRLGVKVARKLENRLEGAPSARDSPDIITQCSNLVGREEFLTNAKHPLLHLLYIHTKGFGRKGYEQRIAAMADGNKTIVTGDIGPATFLMKKLNGMAKDLCKQLSLSTLLPLTTFFDRLIERGRIESGDSGHFHLSVSIR